MGDCLQYEALPTGLASVGPRKGVGETVLGDCNSYALTLLKLWPRVPAAVGQQVGLLAEQLQCMDPIDSHEGP